MLNIRCFYFPIHNWSLNFLKQYFFKRYTSIFHISCLMHVYNQDRSSGNSYCYIYMRFQQYLFAKAVSDVCFGCFIQWISRSYERSWKAVVELVFLDRLEKCSEIWQLWIKNFQFLSRKRREENYHKNIILLCSN